MKIAIIGAGLAGLTAAKMLRDFADITVFEKSRGAGGRMCTRYAKAFNFDHGAQFFTAKTPQFKEFIKPLIKDGVIASWNARFIELENSEILNRWQWGEDYLHYVGTPTMSEIGRYLAKDLNLHLNTEVTINKNGEHWNIKDSKGNDLGNFDWVISTAPAFQSSRLLPDYFQYHPSLKKRKMLACYSLMLGFDEDLDLDWDAALVSETDVSWISVNSSKPGRKDNYSLLVHSTNTWAENHFNDENHKVITHLSNETSNIINRDISNAVHIDLHRWRYANIAKLEKSEPLIDAKNKMAACGDWCIKGRVEAAFRSGFDLANGMRNLVN